MKIPKGKGLDLTGGLVITVVLEDHVLTGTFLGEFEHRDRKDCPINVNVQVDVEPEFILLQLTCELELEDGPEFPVGTIVAINVQEIQFILPGGTCEEDTTVVS